MKKKGLLSTLIIAGILAAPTAAMAEIIPPGYHRDVLPITIHADGAYVPTDVEPIIQAGRTMLPLRAAGEAIGATVNWDQPTQTATAEKNGTTVSFTLNSSTYYINGEAHTTDVAPSLISNRTLLPLRVFAEALDANVVWDNDLRDVRIDTDAADAPAATIPPGTYYEDTAKIIQKYYVAADPSDPLVGSWKHLGHTPNITIYTYHFISKAANGTYNDIWARWYNEPAAPIQNIMIRENTISGNYNNLSGQNPFDSMIYSQGANIGYDQPETYYYTLDTERNLLTATGYYISAYGESKVVELNDIYNKF